MTPQDKQDLLDVARATADQDAKTKGTAAGCLSVFLVAPGAYFFSTTMPEGEPIGIVFFWVAVVFAVMGVLALLAGLFGKPAAAKLVASKDNLRKCPQCAEMIKAEAKKCRYCGSEILPANA